MMDMDGRVRRDGGDKVTVSATLYEKLRRTWTGGWEDDGAAFRTALARLAGAPEGRNEAGEAVGARCRDPTYDDIVVDLGGLDTQAEARIGTLGDRYATVWPAEDLGPFGERRRPGGGLMAWAGRRVEAAMTTGEPRATAQRMMARAARAERAVIMIPPDERGWAEATPGARVLLDDRDGQVVALGTDTTWDLGPMTRALRAWRAGRRAAGAAKLREEWERAGAQLVPDWLRFWDPARCGGEGKQTGWGRSRDCRKGTGGHEKCGSWDPLMGSIGYAPPGLTGVLKGLGVDANAAREVVAGLEHEAALCTRRLWGVRNADQQDAEREVGITDAVKHDRKKQKLWHERRYGEGPTRERLAEIAVQAREAREERRGLRPDGRRGEAGDGDDGDAGAHASAVVCGGCTWTDATGRATRCGNPACCGPLAQPIGAEHARRTVQEFRVRETVARGSDGYWMAVSDRNSGGAAGRGRVRAGARRRREPRDEWRTRYDKWGARPPARANCDQCHRNCHVSTATECARGADCGNYICGECMAADVAMDEGWVCRGCTAADEADAAGEEDEADGPPARRRRRA